VLARVPAERPGHPHHDAASLVTHPPSTYTALVVGANDGMGVAQIDLYDVL